MKPKTEWCRLSALMKWKGWSEGVVRQLRSAKLLKTRRFPVTRHHKKAKKKQRLGKYYYHVPTAENL